MFRLSRLLIVYLVAAPLALFLGYLVSSPNQMSYGAIGIIILFLALPIFLKWHHLLLIIFWNTTINAFFLPGQPPIWLAFAALSFVISCMDHIMTQKPFLRAPALTVAVIFLAGVILGTAFLRGGIGIRALGGSTFGGRYYVFLLVAVIGYFALTAEAVPMAKAKKTGMIFLLAGMTPILSTLAYSGGPSFYFLFYFLPSDTVLTQVASDYGLTNIDRIEGLAQTCTAAFCALLAFYGIRGIFDLSKPWRLLIFCVAIGASFFAGFRSILLVFFLIFAFQFYLEGLMRTHYLPIVAGLAICGFIPILAFSNKMPASVQRAVSFLPVNVDSEVLADAKESSDWRFRMWERVMKDIPKYLILGKGYGIDPTEIYAVAEAQRQGVPGLDLETTILAGDYHSGPLSVLIPFGIFGVIGFVWVLIAGYQVLHSNFRFGDARLRRVNTLLLSYYLASCVAFVFIFGAFNGQLSFFLGLCGISISLNGGVRRKFASKRAAHPIPSQTTVMEAG